MSKWFVRAERNGKSINHPIADQLESKVKIGSIEKVVPFKSAGEVAQEIKASLIKHGWSNVRTVRVDPAPA
jgi:hypothetical protein